MSFDEIRRQQDAEYAESLLNDEEKERICKENELDDEVEPELSIEELREARLKALDVNYKEIDSPKEAISKSEQDSMVYKCQQIILLLEENPHTKQIRNPFTNRLINVYSRQGRNKKYTSLITKIITTAKSELL